MSTIQKVNLEPVSALDPKQLRDFPLLDPTLADPLNANAHVDGEWLAVQNDGVTAARASTVTVVGNEATRVSYPLFAERGRYDIQAMSGRKLPLVYMGDWEFDTRIFNATVVVGAGAAMTFVGQPLKVATITIGTKNVSGLVGHGGAADPSPVVAIISKLPATNGGKLRLKKSGRF